MWYAVEMGSVDMIYTLSFYEDWSRCISNITVIIAAISKDCNVGIINHWHL
jgi:hypothetical protein